LRRVSANSAMQGGTKCRVVKRKESIQGYLKVQHIQQVKKM
jgi:hypothetical protein